MIDAQRVGTSPNPNPNPNPSPSPSPNPNPNPNPTPISPQPEGPLGVALHPDGMQLLLPFKVIGRCREI